jgi:hypothetical protein
MEPASCSTQPTYLFCNEDRALPVDIQRMMVQKTEEATGCKFDTYECAASHSPFLSMPEKVLEVAEKVVRKVHEK